MNAVLWILQVLLAGQFAYHGIVMLFPPAEVPPVLEYINDLPSALRIFIGIAEVLAAAGLILPGLLKIQPRLVPLAALGLAIVMALAAVFHTRRGEPFVGNLVLLALTGLVAYGRWRIKPLPDRSASLRRVGTA